MLKAAEGRDFFFFRHLSMTKWNEWRLASLLKTEWFNNGIRLGTSEPEHSNVVPACMNSHCDSFQLVMINQTKKRIFIIWIITLTDVFTTNLALKILPAVLELALGAGRWVTSFLGLFAGTAGTYVSPLYLLQKNAPKALFFIFFFFSPTFGGCASKAKMLTEWWSTVGKKFTLRLPWVC